MPGGAPGGGPGTGVATRGAQHPVLPHQWFAERLLEALTGRRPVGRLMGHVRNPAWEQLWQLVEQCRDWQCGGHRTPYVQRCVAARPARGVVEAAAVVFAAGRFHALAFRLELAPDRRWRCTAVETA
ncbi:Rv3235 family protein [Streptomyces sp. NPDC059637]|uniref:Rv3235 family protein n=1 Tax=Streptomyces sp. NPDC059637 TaxID=3347752 RepID=UPI0036BA5D59